MDTELLALIQAVKDANLANQNTYTQLTTARHNLKNYIVTNYPELADRLVI